MPNVVFDLCKKIDDTFRKALTAQIAAAVSAPNNKKWIANIIDETVKMDLVLISDLMAYPSNKIRLAA